MSEQKAQEFYLELSEMFDDNKCLEHEKIIALIRVALEKGGQGEMGVFKVCDVLAKVRSTTLKMIAGKKASFDTILEDFAPEKSNKTLALSSKSVVPKVPFSISSGVIVYVPGANTTSALSSSR